MIKGSPKFIAFYLPQYHTIPENDMWWGEGFTEWIRVKNAKPLFPKHNQPRVPYAYYDLSDVNVMRDQAMLAKKYGIYGFCYYHYWFKGKLLLEKPLEQMLVDKGVDIPFCISWANEPWTRAWDGDSKKILMHQEYGTEKDWIKHIDYLIPFFKDSRYIRIDGKPLFLIYRTESFALFDKMIEFWNNYLKEGGYEGVYVVEMLTSYQSKPKCVYSNGVVTFEPMFTLGVTQNILKNIRDTCQKKLPRLFRYKYRIKDFDRIWNVILRRSIEFSGKTIFPGAFTDWDNTPRFNDKSLIFMNGSSEKFKKYLSLLIAKSNSEYIFINAWNEWAEGAYLEPDDKNSYAYLEAIKSIAEKIIIPEYSRTC